MPTANVPTISLAALDDPEQLAGLESACRSWGLFYLVDHGLEVSRLDRLQAEMRRFFALPRETKLGIERTERNAWGYFDRELTKNRRDWKEIFDVGAAETVGPLAGSAPQWPGALDGFRDEIMSWFGECERVSYRILAGIAMNLGLPPSGLDAAFGFADSSFLRLNHYPPCPDPAPADTAADEPRGALGISHHTDAGALTVLLQDDQPGLQVLHNDIWHLVAPRSGALTINIGDVVQVWSNDRYRAPLHRVLANREAERYSAAFFFNPAYATDYAPLPSCLSEGEPPRYRPINWGAFRSGRAAGDYADYGEEIQISHFRTDCRP